eukprot:7072904-Pyramimonas_sp.AAC.1
MAPRGPPHHPKRFRRHAALGACAGLDQAPWVEPHRRPAVGLLAARLAHGLSQDAAGRPWPPGGPHG